MSKLVDFVIDYETLGGAPEGATIDLAAICFVNDPHNPPTFNELIARGTKVKFNLSEQKNNGSYPRVFDPSTIDWWKQQSVEARKNLEPLPTDVKIDEGIRHIEEFLKSQGVDSWKSQGWCRGMSFDFAIMVNQIRQVYKSRDTFNKEWCKFWNQRDIRTAIESTLMCRDMTECPLPTGSLDGFIAHDSIHDCAKDVLMLIYAQRYAMGLELVPTEETADPRSLKKSR